MPTEAVRTTRCGTCQWWHGLSTDAQGFVTGECRRHCPQVTWNALMEYVTSAWPETDPYAWCGEWEARCAT